MNKKYIATLIAGSSLLSGCSLTNEEPKLLVDLSSKPTQVEATSPSTTSSEPSNLTLPAALALTLERSPELKSYSQNVRVGEARTLQADLLPNPEISVAIEDAFGPYGNGSYSQATLLLSQVIELGGKRSARVNQAEAFHGQLKEEYEIKRVEVLSSLTDKFIRTVADEHLLKLAEKAEVITKKSLSNIQERAKVGGVSEVEEAKARVLVARAHIEAEHAEHELLSSKRQLSSFWGVDEPSFKQITTDLFQDTNLPTFEKLSSRIDSSPEIRKWANEKRLREAEKKLAESKAIPNIAIGAGPRRLHQSNEESWVFQLSVPLNIFDMNQGARQEAEVLSEKTVFDEEASRLKLRTTLFELYQEAKHSRTQLESMKNEIIPQAERALRAAQAGYEKGSLSYLELIDAQRTLVEVLRENIETAYSFHSFLNSIERLLGAPLND